MGGADPRPYYLSSGFRDKQLLVLFRGLGKSRLVALAQKRVLPTLNPRSTLGPVPPREGTPFGSSFGVQTLWQRPAVIFSRRMAWIPVAHFEIPMAVLRSVPCSRNLHWGSPLGARSAACSMHQLGPVARLSRSLSSSPMVLSPKSRPRGLYSPAMLRPKLCPQCFAKCPLTCQFDRLTDQLCQSLDRLSDHFAKHCRACIRSEARHLIGKCGSTFSSCRRPTAAASSRAPCRAAASDSRTLSSWPTAALDSASCEYRISVIMV